MKQYVRGETPVEEAISLIVQSLPYPKGTETVSLLRDWDVFWQSR